jgi:hypothetical protein
VPTTTAATLTIVANAPIKRLVVDGVGISVDPPASTVTSPVDAEWDGHNHTIAAFGVHGQRSVVHAAAGVNAVRVVFEAPVLRATRGSSPAPLSATNAPSPLLKDSLDGR